LNPDGRYGKARAIGGTHLVGRSPDYLDKTIVELEKFDLKLISPCHCSGFVGMARLWNAFSQRFCSELQRKNNRSWQRTETPCHLRI
jgi:metal-dependent hydrolase (beta-lactamase superfamily II)